jgi:hypothetical protein
MLPKPLPPIELVLDVLSYDPATGFFRWKKRLSNRVKVGDAAGTQCGEYMYIKINGANHQSHRLAWLIVNGAGPEALIDHKDGNGLNNRISNLREATNLQNSWNAKLKRTNKSGVKGVSWDKVNGKWRAHIQIRGRQIQLGRFAELQDAAATVKSARVRLHAGFARHE